MLVLKNTYLILFRLVVLSYMLALTGVASSQSQSQQAQSQKDSYQNILLNNSYNNQQAQRLSAEKRALYRITLNTFPNSIGTPSYSATFTQANESASLTFWNRDISGETYLFVQLEVLSETFFFCPSGNQFEIMQNGTNYGQAFRVTRGDSLSVCESISEKEIFLVDQWLIFPNFIIDEAFTVLANLSGLSGSLTVNATPTATPTPTPTPTPTTTPVIAPTPTPIPTNTPNSTSILDSPLFENCNLNTVDNDPELTCKGVTQATCNDLLKFNLMMDWAETLNPELLSDGTTTFSILGYLARHYIYRDLYVGTREGRIYAVGDRFGDEIVDLGSLQSYLDSMQTLAVEDWLIP